MEMRAGRSPGGTHAADDLALRDPGARRNEESGEVTVSRTHSVAVVNLDHTAIAPSASGEDHGPCRRGENRRSGSSRYVYAGMEARSAIERIAPRSKP
jgi:hypothetical protein